MGRYDLLDKLVGMLGGVAPVDAIRVYRETPYMSNIPGLADFDVDRAERALEHYPGGGTQREQDDLASACRAALAAAQAASEAGRASTPVPPDPRYRPDPPYPTPRPANVVDIDTRRW